MKTTKSHSEIVCPLGPCQYVEAFGLEIGFQAGLLYKSAQSGSNFVQKNISGARLLVIIIPGLADLGVSLIRHLELSVFCLASLICSLP